MYSRRSEGLGKYSAFKVLIKNNDVRNLTERFLNLSVKKFY